MTEPSGSSRTGRVAVLLVFVPVLALVAQGVWTGVSSSNASAAAEYEYDSGHLVVVKHVVNDNGRAAVASDFTMTIGGVPVFGGNPFAGSEAGTDKLVGSGSYSVSETGPAGYLPAYSSGCSGSIAAGQTITCTVTNDDVAAPLALVSLCLRNRTITVQQKFVAGLLARGATLGPC
jgi:prealbumin domain-containing protein